MKPVRIASVSRRSGDLRLDGMVIVRISGWAAWTKCMRWKKFQRHQLLPEVWSAGNAVRCHGCWTRCADGHRRPVHTRRKVKIDQTEGIDCPSYSADGRFASFERTALLNSAHSIRTYFLPRVFNEFNYVKGQDFHASIGDISG